MLFNSYQYLLFLPVVCVLYYCIAHAYRWAVLFAASCVFYMYFIPEYILCLFFLIIVDFIVAKKIAAAGTLSRKKALLAFSVISNFGLLFYFKYFNFLLTLLNTAFLPEGRGLALSEALLPIGLSFHTFQSVSYVVDVYRNKLQPERHLGIYSVYVLFFPQMVAGPIERFASLGLALKATRPFEWKNVQTGFRLLVIGYFYKMVIADNCGEYVNTVYADLGSRAWHEAFAAILLFCVQIYGDFFGYSLIAQGSAMFFGIHLMDNFRFPLLAANIVEFWKRWHISLTAWFREYVYIPLGGNRVTAAKYAFNILLVFALSGLWHGAGVSFILWGVLHGIAYLLTTRLRLPGIPGLVSALLTFLLVSFIFVFFRLEISGALAVLRQVFSFAEGATSLPFPVIAVFQALVVFAIEGVVSRRYPNYLHIASGPGAYGFAMLYYMFFSVVLCSGVDNLPFIYFQF